MRRHWLPARARARRAAAPVAPGAGPGPWPKAATSTGRGWRSRRAARPRRSSRRSVGRWQSGWGASGDPRSFIWNRVPAVESCTKTTCRTCAGCMCDDSPSLARARQRMNTRRTGTLWVVATPIGNLEDFSPRAQRVLREVALIAAEDTRHSKPLLAHFGIGAPLMALHEHNEREAIAPLLARLQAGEDIALIDRKSVV